MIRTIWVTVLGSLATVVYGFWGIATTYATRDPHIFERLARRWARFILRRSGVRVHVEGLEHVDIGKPQIFMANHQSWYDVFALLSEIPKRYRFVGKKELEKIPVFGTCWKLAGHISIDRGDRIAAIRALDEAGEVIRRDASSVVIFPEGTRSRDGNMLPFKKGGFMLALRTGVDVVPVAILGSRAVLSKGKWRIRGGPIILRFGEPIRTAEMSVDERDSLMAEVRSRIEAMISRPAPLLRR
ncbi:MAG TPA: lysophospholipid acyltransferase family protein [Longimicrobiales bacterium]|nr:lysophospholipid acyltransferase family protein [Longimicrobiales bacterium]